MPYATPAMLSRTVTLWNTCPTSQKWNLRRSSRSWGLSFVTASRQLHRPDECETPRRRGRIAPYSAHPALNLDVQRVDNRCGFVQLEQIYRTRAGQVGVVAAEPRVGGLGAVETMKKIRDLGRNLHPR